MPNLNSSIKNTLLSHVYNGNSEMTWLKVYRGTCSTRFWSLGPWFKSSALRPVKSSRRTTPNAYTSLCKVSFPVWYQIENKPIMSSTTKLEMLNIHWGEKVAYRCILRVEVAKCTEDFRGDVHLLVLRHHLSEAKIWYLLNQKEQTSWTPKSHQIPLSFRCIT